MTHTVRNKELLIKRVRRLRGQLDAVERALSSDRDCSEILHALAACRGAITGLTAEVIEDHIRYHVFDEKRGGGRQATAARELVEVVKTYFR
jgi:DNA-binding FrmR family transcriptional regulator